MIPPKIIILLLPGMDGTGDLFAELAFALQGELECVTVRYPTNLWAYDGNLSEYVRTAFPQFAPFVLLAESFSTPLAIKLASEPPPNLRALILCAGFASSPIKGWRRVFCKFLAPAALRVKMPDQIIRWLLAGKDAPQSLVNSIRAAIESIPVSTLAARIQAVLACDTSNELSRITLPILFIRGTNDRLVSVSAFQEMLKLKPNASAASIDGPHLILQRQPDRAAAITIDFIRRR